MPISPKEAAEVRSKEAKNQIVSVQQSLDRTLQDRYDGTQAHIIIQYNATLLPGVLLDVLQSYRNVGWDVEYKGNSDGSAFVFKPATGFKPEQLEDEKRRNKELDEFYHPPTKKKFVRKKKSPPKKTEPSIVDLAAERKGKAPW